MSDIATITGPSDMTTGEAPEYLTDDTEPKVTITYRDNEDGTGAQCRHCGMRIAEYPGEEWQDQTGETECTDNDDDNGDPGVHQPETAAPWSWLNSASADINGDVVQVNISVGSPLGALQMAVWRNPHTGRLMLKVPHPSDSMPHVSLVEISDGTYEIRGA